MRQVFDAVAYLHSKGIAHRDLKPENLMSVGEGQEEVIKLADFVRFSAPRSPSPLGRRSDKRRIRVAAKTLAPR